MKKALSRIAAFLATKEKALNDRQSTEDDADEWYGR